MTTPPKKRVVKTPGQRLHHHAYARGKVITKWSDLTYLSKQDYESDAADLGIQPLTEDVPEPQKTDGELLYEAAKPHTICGVLGAADKVAAEFLRLRAERDGEPLEVTKEIIADWYMEWRAGQDTPRQSEWFVFLTAKITAKITAHRGVRSVPQVTEEDIRELYTFSGSGFRGMAAELNAKLAKQAGKVGGQ